MSNYQLNSFLFFFLKDMSSPGQSVGSRAQKDFAQN